MLNEREQKRYLRQLILPDFGDAAQQKLKNSTVFIAGAGGLGGPVALYLAAAGVGRLIIADRDAVELSNLNRQILHSTDDIDVAKSVSAKETLSKLNPEIKIITRQINIDDNSISKLAAGADIIVDCLDNIPTRYVLNRYAIAKGIPIMHAGIDCWTAQLSFIQPPDTACLHCLFESFVENGAPKPVLGAVAGVLGTMQALETLKYLAGMEMTLKNKLLFFDAQEMEWTKLDLYKSEHCPVCSKL